MGTILALPLKLIILLFLLFCFFCCGGGCKFCFFFSLGGWGVARSCFGGRGRSARKPQGICILYDRPGLSPVEAFPVSISRPPLGKPQRFEGPSNPSRTPRIESYGIRIASYGITSQKGMIPHQRGIQSLEKPIALPICESRSSLCAGVCKR